MTEPARPREGNALAYALPVGQTVAGGLSPRQQRLTKLWHTVRCATYDARKTAWDGTEHLDGLETDVLAAQRYVPPGFYDMGGALLPLRFRRPTAPYYLAKLIVARFSGLLFSSQRHPRIAAVGDPETDDFLTASVEVGRLWSRMFQARMYGGAMGSVGLGFTFRRGVPAFEVFDPRWCTPSFVDEATREVASLAVRYEYARDERDRTGQWTTRGYWYRRVITDETDTVWSAVPVGDGSEPVWEVLAHTIVEHGYGECPVVWVQNLPVEDDLDGDPDAQGCYDSIEEIDRLVAQACRGILANCVGVETPFITRDGVRQFSDFKDGDTTTVLTHTGSWKRARVRSFGEQRLFRVRLGRGSNYQVVRATRDHRWLLADGHTTNDLSVGNKLAKPPHLIRDWSYEESSEEARRYWAQGFLFGDGSLYQSKRKDGYHALGSKLRLCGAKNRFLPRFEALGCEATYPPSSEGDANVILRGYMKTLPTVEKDGYENVMAFVRGYLDADGSRNVKHPETSDINPFQGISVTGKAAVAFVREVFPTVGAYIVNEDDRTEDVAGYGPYTDETVYFSLVLGFSNSPVAPYIVREIVEDAVETVWCLEVEDDQSFVLPSGVVTRNCDPTLFLSTDASLRDVAKGSDNAIKLEKGGTASYLEIAGQGPKAAFDAAERLEQQVCRTARVVLDQSRSQTTKTATEVDRDYSAMWEQTDVLREQYGECGVKRLLEKYLRACRRILSTVRRDPETGLGIRSKIVLPPRVDEQKDGPALLYERTLGDGETLALKWPAYTRPTADDSLKRVQAAGQALGFGVVDKEHAAAFIAEDFQVENVKEMLERAAQDAEAAAKDAYAEMTTARNAVPTE